MAASPQSRAVMRSGSVYRRCGKCSRRYPKGKCPVCPSGTKYSWGYAVDLIRPGGTQRGQTFKAGYRTKEDAENALRQILEPQRGGRFVKPTEMTVLEYFERWVANLDPAQPKARMYRGYIENHIAKAFGSMQIQDLAFRDITTFYGALRTEGNAKSGKGLANSTVVKIHRFLHMVLADAVREDLIVKNPAEKANRTQGRTFASQADQVWSPEEVSTFLELSRNRPHAALWRILVMTGMRRGEALGLTWRMVAGSRLTVVRQNRARAGEDQARTKTDASERLVAIDGETVRQLDDHRTAQASALAALGIRQTPDTFVFDRGDGQPLNPDTVSRRFKSLIHDMPLRQIPLKNLRHTHATIGLRAGVHIKVMSGRLGHSSITVTADRYSFAVPGLDADAAEAVASQVATSSALVQPLSDTSAGRAIRAPRARRGETYLLDELEPGSTLALAVASIENAAGSPGVRKQARCGIARFLRYCADAGLLPADATLEWVDGPYRAWLSGQPSYVAQMCVHARKLVRALGALDLGRPDPNA